MQIKDENLKPVYYCPECGDKLVYDYENVPLALGGMDWEDGVWWCPTHGIINKDERRPA